jgi:hypothetical protein
MPLFVGANWTHTSYSFRTCGRLHDIDRFFDKKGRLVKVTIWRWEDGEPRRIAGFRLKKVEK